MTSRPVWAASKPSRTQRANDLPSTTIYHNSVHPPGPREGGFPPGPHPPPQEHNPRPSSLLKKNDTDAHQPRCNPGENSGPSRPSSLAYNRPTAQAAASTVMLCCPRRHHYGPPPEPDHQGWERLTVILRRRQRLHNIKSAIQDFTEHDGLRQDGQQAHPALPAIIWTSGTEHGKCYHLKPSCLGLNFATEKLSRRPCRVCTKNP